MSTRFQHACRAAMLLAASLTCASAAVSFIAPAEGPVAFRRDQIPLDVETLSSLSKQLVLLAQSQPADAAAQRRGIAQMLALATSLDPGNREAQELIHEFQLGTHEPTPAGPSLEQARARIWQYIGWLETPEAGDQGKALADCLGDVMALADPQHPRAATRKNGEHGQWNGWVPPLAKYEPQSLEPTEETTPTQDPQATPPTLADKKVILTEAEVWTMLWARKPEAPKQEDRKEIQVSWSPVCAPISLAARETEGSQEPLKISFSQAQGHDGGALGQTAEQIHKLLQAKHGRLAHGSVLEITSPALRESILSGRRQSVSAATAVLANASLTGKAPEAIVLGIVDATGAYSLPTGFWEQLSSLGTPTKGPRRLVLPAAAADFLPSLLAMEKPQFFMDYEVVLAADAQQLFELAAKSPTGPFADSHAKFQEIQSKMGTLNVGSYVANPYIRRRLSDLAQEAPYHYSARMLSIQGAGGRPIDIPSAVLIPELRKAVAPMMWFLKDRNSIELIGRNTTDPFGKVNTSQEPLLQSYESSRAMVDALDRYVQKPDRDLYNKVKELLATVRTFERSVRARSDSMTTRAAVERAYLLVADALADPSVKTEER